MAPDDAPGKLLAMLQPLRQLESNWSVDLAGELAGYYEELSSLDFEVDGITGLDFTDAALVVYHSSCTYSKKVEHLMKLTMSALESVKVKRKAKKGNSRDRKAEDEDSILTGHHWGKKMKRIRSLVKDRDAFAVLVDAEAAPPLLKEALRADHFPTVGDTVASETAQAATASAAQGPTDAPTFNTMRSHNHISGAQLLLQQSGTLFDTNLNMLGVGAYARPSDSNRRQPLQQEPGMTVAAEQPVNGFGSPVGEQYPAPPPDDFGDMWCGDDGGGDDGWGEAPPSPPAGPMDTNTTPHVNSEEVAVEDAELRPGAGLADAAVDEEEDEGLGVWEPLDPHEKTGGNKPFKQHIPKIPKLKTSLKEKIWQPLLIPEPLECARTRVEWMHHVPFIAAPESPKRTKKKRCAAFAPLEPGPALEETDPPELHADDEEPAPLETMEPQADGPDATDWPADDGPDFAGGDDFAYDDVREDHLDPVFPGMEGDGAEEAMYMAGTQYEVQAAPSGALAYEDLVAQYSQAVAEASAAALAQSSLSRMVSSWRENITSVMNEQDRRPAFDIQKTGEELVTRAGMLYKQKAAALRFVEIINCQHPYEVARNFSAFLQQVNEGKVLLQREENPAEPFYVSVPA